MTYDLYKFIRPLIFTLDPETAHRLTLQSLRLGLVPGATPVTDAALRQTLWNRVFPSPVGMAAGFDKNAEAIYPLFKLGFGFVEAGTVTPRPQPGNPRPRIFREPSTRAVINRMGFPGEGLAVFKANLEKFLERRPRPAGVVGINIGMNKGQTEPEKDYCQLVHALGPLADYLTVNISSPNTPGLRNLQQREHLAPLLRAILDQREKSCGRHAPPLLLKLAPDLTDIQAEEIAQTVMEAGIDGLILTNTTLARPETLPAKFAAETGGLSGAPLTRKSTAMIHKFYALTGGRLPIIGAGGIMSAADAYDKIRAGASLVQVYSGLVYEGPGMVGTLNEGLRRHLLADGYAHIGEAVGADHRQGKTDQWGGDAVPTLSARK